MSDIRPFRYSPGDRVCFTLPGHPEGSARVAGRGEPTEVVLFGTVVGDDGTLLVRLDDDPVRPGEVVEVDRLRVDGFVPVRAR